MIDDNDMEADDMVANIELASGNSDELEYSDGFEDSDVDSIESPPYSPISNADEERTVSSPCSSITNVFEEVNSPIDKEMITSGSLSFDVAITESYTWNGYKFIGDNVDKTLKASFQRSDHRGMSIHCFHGYAVKDSQDLSEVCPESTTPDPTVFIPSDADVKALKKEFYVFISRYVMHFKILMLMFIPHTQNKIFNPPNLNNAILGL